MSIETQVPAARILEHDVRNQLGNIYLAVEGIKAELGEKSNSEDFACYTDIIISCCKQVENMIKQVK